MINRKPFFFLYLILSLTFFVSCTRKESLVFEKQRITQQTVLDCSSDSCASIEINSIHCLSEGKVATTINRTLEKTTCSLLHVSETEPEKTIEEAIHAFNTFYQEMKTEFSEETVPYEVMVDYEISFQNTELISVLVEQYIFTGGAHGYGAISFLNFNTKTGKNMSNAFFLKDIKNFNNYCESLFRKKYEIPEKSSINSTGFFFENDTFQLPEAIGFTDQEILLIFDQYEMETLLNETIELRLPKIEVARFFKISI